jgi:photosystem II stability/assembly factor-like uncharacterized protein
MSRFQISILSALWALGLPSLLSFAVSCAYPEKQASPRSENSILGKLTSDEDDPTVTLCAWENDGLLIRTHSIWSTGDAGATWELVSRVSPHRGPSSFETVWLRSKTDIFAQADGALFESANQGRGWTKKGTIPSSTGSFLAIAGDEAESWLVGIGQRSVPTSGKRLSMLPKYADDVTSTPQAPRMLVPAITVTHDDGLSWKSARLPEEIGPLDRVVVSGRFAIAVGPYAILTTTNKGESWIAPKEVGLGDKEETYPVSAAIFGRRLWVSLKNGTLMRGDIFKQELTAASTSATPLESLAFTDSCTGFALRNEELVTTEDSGTTWRDVTHSKDIVAFTVSQKGILVATHDRVLHISLQQRQSGAACVN